jgi:CBS domain-containing protein
MRPYSRGLRVQVYVGETDQVGHVPRYQAILEYLRREGAAGATVVRGVAGFGANSRIHTAAILRLSMDLPIVLTWIDAPGRVERLLPGLRALAGSGIVTVEEIGVAAYGGRRLEQLRFDLPIRDVMTTPVVSIAETAAVRDAVALLVDRPFRALPVVDTAGRVVGILSSGDLVTRAGLEARIELLSAMPAAARRAIVERLDPVASVGDVMTAKPATIGDAEPVSAATHAMADGAIKRLPVCDADGRLVGIVSRCDILRAVGETFPRDAVVDRGDPGARTIGAIMRPDAPAVDASADLATLLDVVASTRLNRAVVLDTGGAVLGVVSDADVIRSVDPTAGVLGALMRTAGRPAGSDVTAGSLVARPALTMLPETPIADAAERMTAQGRKVVCVVDPAGKLLGIVDRADLLRAAGAALRGPATGDDPEED